MGGSWEQGKSDVSGSHSRTFSNFGSCMTRGNLYYEIWGSTEGRYGGSCALSDLNSNAWEGGQGRGLAKRMWQSAGVGREWYVGPKLVES